MQKVVDYKLMVNETPSALANEVNQQMKEGWVPSGTVVIFKDMLVQAMVKFEES